MGNNIISAPGLSIAKIWIVNPPFVSEHLLQDMFLHFIDRIYKIYMI